MSGKRQAAGLALVGASAGSGKTHQLTETVLEALGPEAKHRIDVAGLVGVTYTRRAAAELEGRIRRSLVQAGAHDEASRLPLSYLGTVHSVCLRLLQEHALDVGLSPQVDVMAGSEQRLLREALERELPHELRRSVQDLAFRLQIRWDQVKNKPDWLTPVSDIMTLARSNRIAPANLPAMAERSAEDLLGLLGKPERDGGALNQKLATVLASTERALAKINDGTKATKNAHRHVKGVLSRAKRGGLRWNEWVKLQGVMPAKAGRAAVSDLHAVAALVDRHPGLHQDIRDYTQAIFRAAQIGLEAYADWKRRRRVVDFVDMVDSALTLVEKPEVAAELAANLELLTVDEFQDTSPVQLALFVRLHQLAGRSTWVGDPKQCIFEFAGADPALMDAVSDWARAQGGEERQLPNNWRSRPELVELTSQLFAATLKSHGFAPETVTTAPVRETPKAMRKLPPLGLWQLESSNKAGDADAIAAGIQRLLRRPDATPVFDKNTDAVRALQPGDIAVLVATNAEATNIGDALAQRGIRSAVARQGLLATPEGTLVDAALRYLLDDHDSLSAAVLQALFGFPGTDPDTWLADTIIARDAARAARDAGEPPPESTAKPAWFQSQLERLRPRAATQSPTEVLDEVIAVLDVEQLCARWPDPRQRLSNLDALRALACEYEEHCTHAREAGTVAGLLRYFDEAAQPRLMRDEEIASDDQHVSMGPHAVTVCSYHRAKGLEWPVVILGSLDRAERRDAFEVSPATDRAEFNAEDPLGGRWIRYWPWPYGASRKTRLSEVAAASPHGRAVAEREHRERARLLYVGFTRARDHLILAARSGKQGLKSQWLDELKNEDGQLLTLPASSEESDTATTGLRGLKRTAKVSTRHWILCPGDGLDDAAPASELHARFERSGDTDSRAAATTRATGATAEHERAPFWIAPSRGQADWPDLPTKKATEVTRIGDRLPLGNAKGIDWSEVGNAMHAFLAADVTGADRRLHRARSLLEAAQLTALLAPESLLEAGDQLRAWVDARFPGATWHREVPVAALLDSPDGNRGALGVIDLLLETDAGLIIVDHKSFPGAQSDWTAFAEEASPQLAAYAAMVTMAGKRVVETWFHFPVGGGVVRVE